MNEPTGIVWAADPDRPWLAARTARSLRAAGIADVVVVPAGTASPTSAAASAAGATPVPPAGRPVLAVRAGAWLRADGPPAPPPPSATGRPVVAVGLPRSGGAAAAWRAVVGRCGGDFSGEPALPPALCAWLPAGGGGGGDGNGGGPTARDELLRSLMDGSPAAALGTAPDAAFGPAPDAGRRLVHWPPLDVDSDDPDPDPVNASDPFGLAARPADGDPTPSAFAVPRLRVLQVVTSLQQGGAERVAWDLHAVLPTLGVAGGLATLGRGLRRELPDVADRVDLSGVPGDWAAAVAGLARRSGADLIHAHLIRGDDAARLSRLAGLPLVMTVHNTRQGWPPGLDRLGPGDSALLVACARAVERDVAAAGLTVPARTAWNGIDVGAYAGTASARQSRSRDREGAGQSSCARAPTGPQDRTSSGLLDSGTRSWTAADSDARRTTPGPADRLVLGHNSTAPLPHARGSLIATPRPPPELVDVPSSATAGGTSLTLACVANPRPQKRLHLLPAVLAAVRDELARRRGDGRDDRDVRLVLAGESGGTGAAAALDAFRQAAAAAGVTSQIEWTDGRRPVADVLATADVFVSVSAHEGLSLAQLEALAAGLPVVATDVGGAAEVAYRNPAVTLVPVNASPATFAAAVIEAAEGVGMKAEGGRMNGEVPGSPPPGSPPLSSFRLPPSALRLSRDFSRERMAARYAWLYRAALGPPRGDALWFVANNLSVGGAQSSLRRLVLALHADRVPVRVAVLQEHPDHPTPGREALARAGVPVTVLPPAGTVEVEDAVARLLAAMAAAPPRAVAFWNVIQSYKLLLADALLRVPAYDVSPGEMFYDSLDRYLANPRPGLPYRSARDYGGRLAGVVVKYAAEASTARDRLGTPVHVIPNGVPLPPTDAAAATAAGRDARAAVGRLVIGTAARLHPHKRIEDLIDAFRLALPRLPRGAVFRVIGGPDADCEAYVASLRERAAGLPVEWVGEVVGSEVDQSRDRQGATPAYGPAPASADRPPMSLPDGRGSDRGGFHAGLDVFAMVSEPAGCPNASLEAMAAGLPVVATDVGGAAEQVADGVTGRLVPPRDVAAFADALVEVGTCADRRRAMGSAAVRRIDERFSLDGMVRAYRRVLET